MRFALSLLALLFGWTALAHDTTNCAYPSSNCSVGNLSLMPNGFISIPNSGTSKQICFDPPVCGNNLMWNSSTSRLMSSANMELQGTVSINGNINLNSSGVLVQQINGLPLTIKGDRKSTRLNSSHANISYAVFCLKKKKKNGKTTD